jgi:hypothetical protein
LAKLFCAFISSFPRESALRLSLAGWSAKHPGSAASVLLASAPRKRLTLTKAPKAAHSPGV